MDFRQSIAGPLLAVLNGKRAMFPPPPGFRIALLHDVTPIEIESLRGLLRHIVDAGNLLDPSDIEKYYLEDPSPSAIRAPMPEGTLFTFDDGFRSNYAAAIEVLEPLGARAVFFICPALVDLNPDAQAETVNKYVRLGGRAADEGRGERCLMNWDELRELRDRGHVVGCHGMRHRKLATLPASALDDEILGGADLLAERMGERTPWYAYAFGDIKSISAVALSTISTRFPICRSGIRGLNTATTSPLTLRADHVDLSLTHRYRQLTMEGGLDLMYVAARRRLNAIGNSMTQHG